MWLIIITEKKDTHTNIRAAAYFCNINYDVRRWRSASHRRRSAHSSRDSRRTLFHNLSTSSQIFGIDAETDVDDDDAGAFFCERVRIKWYTFEWTEMHTNTHSHTLKFLCVAQRWHQIHIQIHKHNKYAAWRYLLCGICVIILIRSISIQFLLLCRHPHWVANKQHDEANLALGNRKLNKRVCTKKSRHVHKTPTSSDRWVCVCVFMYVNVYTNLVVRARSVGKPKKHTTVYMHKYTTHYMMRVAAWRSLRRLRRLLRLLLLLPLLKTARWRLIASTVRDSGSVGEIRTVSSYLGRWWWLSCVRTLCDTQCGAGNSCDLRAGLRCVIAFVWGRVWYCTHIFVEFWEQKNDRNLKICSWCGVLFWAGNWIDSIFQLYWNSIQFDTTLFLPYLRFIAFKVIETEYIARKIRE